jgi:hypothetical protein
MDQAQTLLEHVCMEIGPQIVFDYNEIEIYNQKSVPRNHQNVFDTGTPQCGSLQGP